MAKENPEQFFNILPYAYILDVTYIWLNKFNSILETNPQIYEPNYNTLYFSKLLSSMNYATSPSYANGGLSSSSYKDSSSSSSSHSYHSSSGGGGFSGGGGGGGGGSSW